MRKKLFSISAACLSGLLLGVLASCGPASGSTDSTGSSAGGSGFDISVNGDKSVLANVESKANGKNKLVISGTGRIKDFANATDRPYAKNTTAAANIDEVVIGNQITYVGRNAFRGLSISSVVLPTSVTEIGYTIVDDDDLICSLGTNKVTQPSTSKATIYYYSENVPSTQYRYYLKDSANHSPADITAGVTEDSTKYWHYVGEDVAVYNKKKVLFIGNSFSFRNGTSVDENGGVPRIFSEIAKNLGEYVETWAVMGSALTLAQHADKTSATGAQVDKLLTKYSDFDAVVLQEQSTRPLTAEASFLAGAQSLATAIRKNNSNAKIALYETWGYPSKAADNGGTVQNMERSLRKAYNRVGAEINADVVKVGSAFTYVTNDSEHNVPLWAADNMHQSYYGAYLSASIWAGALLNVDVKNTTYVNDSTLQDPADQANADVLAYLRTVAYNCVFDPTFDPDTDVVITTNPLHIAMYDKYITEENFNKLLNAFKVYCDSQNLGTSKITYTIYNGLADSDPCYTAANLAKEVQKDVLEDGSYRTDVLFPVGNNINSSGNWPEGTLPNDQKTAMPTTVFGQASRYIARLNNNEFTMTFYNWMLSDEALKIMNPEYVSEQPGGPSETVTYDLEVAVWGRYVSEENFNTVWNSFKTKRSAALEGKNIHYTYYEGASSGVGSYGVDTFVANIKKNEAKTDVIFPSGSNMTSSGSNRFENDYVAHVKLGTNVFGKADRYITTLDANDLTVAFKNFLLSQETKALMDDTYTAATIDLKIAVWGRYILESQMDQLLTAFAATEAAKDKVIEYSFIGSKASTDANYGVDNFVVTAAAYNPDVIFPAGSNITSKYTASTVTATAITGTVFGADKRYIGVLNDNELTLAFQTWILSAEAQAIYAPAA